MVAGDRFALPMFLAYETGMVTGPYPLNYLSIVKHTCLNVFYNSGALRIHAYPTTPRTLL